MTGRSSAICLEEPSDLLSVQENQYSREEERAGAHPKKVIEDTNERENQFEETEEVERSEPGGLSTTNGGPRNLSGLLSRESTITDVVLEDGTAMETEPTAVEPHEPIS
jgi:hypothetical protein